MTCRKRSATIAVRRRDRWQRSGRACARWKRSNGSTSCMSPVPCKAIVRSPRSLGLDRKTLYRKLRQYGQDQRGRGLTEHSRLLLRKSCATFAGAKGDRQSSTMTDGGGRNEGDSPNDSTASIAIRHSRTVAHTYCGRCDVFWDTPMARSFDEVRSSLLLEPWGDSRDQADAGNSEGDTPLACGQLRLVTIALIDNCRPSLALESPLFRALHLPTKAIHSWEIIPCIQGFNSMIHPPKNFLPTLCRRHRSDYHWHCGRDRAVCISSTASTMLAPSECRICSASSCELRLPRIRLPEAGPVRDHAKGDGRASIYNVAMNGRVFSPSSGCRQSSAAVLSHHSYAYRSFGSAVGPPRLLEDRRADGASRS